MKTLIVLNFILTIWINYKVYELNPKKFNPLDHGVVIWLSWAFSTFISISILSALIFNYLP